MSVGREQAERIAHLARLRFEDDELTTITEELNHILEHVEALREVGSTGDEGTTAEDLGDAAAASAAATRDEDADHPDTLVRPLDSFAPDWREGFFVVPPLPGTQGSDGA